MWGLDPSIDLSFLLGRELLLVEIAKGTVAFSFDEDVKIMVEGEFQHHFDKGYRRWRPGEIQTAAQTLNLLGSIVRDAVGKADGTLEIEFSNGERLVILDSSKEYESYQIIHRGPMIIV